MKGIPDDFFQKLITETDGIAMKLLNLYCIDCYSQNDLETCKDVKILIHILKHKLIMIYKKTDEFIDFNLIDIVFKLKSENASTVHDITFYGLLNQNSCEQMENLFSIVKCETSLFGLEIINAILDTCLLTKNDLLQKYVAENNFETDILNFLISDNKVIYTKVVVDIVPKYYRYSHSKTLLKLIYKNVKTTLLFNMICILEHLFIPVTPIDIEFCILFDKDFWILLQSSIINGTYLVRKQCIYILKRATNVILENTMYIEKINENVDILIIKKDTDIYKSAWKHFFILCEIVAEKQMHLIEPTFQLYVHLSPLHNSWRLCITKQFLNHSHSAVIRYTINEILTNRWIYNIEILVNGLNYVFLYDKHCENNILENLRGFILKLTQEEFKNFVMEFHKIKPNAIPIYYVSIAIQDYKLDAYDKDILKTLIDLSLTVNNKFLRDCIIYSVVKFFVKITKHNSKNITFELLFDNVKETAEYMYQCNYNHCLVEKALESIICFSPNIWDFFRKNIIRPTPEFSMFMFIMKEKNIFLSEYEIYILNETQNLLKCDLEGLPYFIYAAGVLEILYAKPNIKYISSSYWETQITEISEKVISKISTIICTQNEIDQLFINSLYSVLNKLYIMLREKETNFYIKQIFKLLSNLYDAKKHILFFEIWELMYRILTPQTYYDKVIKLLNDSENQQLEICLQTLTIETYNNTKIMVTDGYFTVKVCLLLKTLNGEKNYMEIIDMLNTYLDIGGPDTVLAVVHATKNILLNYCTRIPDNMNYKIKDLIQRCQDELFQRGLGTILKSKYIELIAHLGCIKNSILMQATLNFAKKLFDESYSVNDFSILRRLFFSTLSNFSQNIHELKDAFLYCYDIFVEAILHRPLFRKEQRIEYDTCLNIKEKLKSGSASNYIIWSEIPCEDHARCRMNALLICSTLIMYFWKQGKNEIQNMLFNTLIEKYNKYFGKRYFENSQLHFLKLRVMQFLLLIIDTDIILTKGHTDWLYDCLTNEAHQISVKILIQWICVKVFIKYSENLNETVLLLMLKAKDLQGTSVASVFPVLYHLCKQCSSNTVTECLKFLQMYTMGPHFSVRYSAQVAIKYIYEYNNQYQRNSTLYCTVLRVLKETSNDKIQDPFHLSYLDLNEFYTLETIYYELPRLTGVQNTEWCSEAELMTRFVSTFEDQNSLFIAIYNKNKYLSNLNRQSIKKISNEKELNDEFTNVQKKIETWDVCLETKKMNGHLIVVASLIDRIPNLGGLSRTCEVFGVLQYVLNDAQMIKSKEYQNLSMSSEKWVDTKEVKICDLPVYLKQMKENDYAIVGAEQTAESLRLDEFKFAKNTVLVLGNEKEGIPANLIHLMDVCLEIPQFGQIRSLNVHVAGAVFIWEYTKQHCQNS